MNKEINVEIIQGTGKKSGKDYEAIKLTIGDWSQLVFPRSAFELNYIKEILEAQNVQKASVYCFGASLI